VVSHCFRLRNDLYCVEWGVKLYSLTHPVVCWCVSAALWSANGYQSCNLPSPDDDDDAGFDDAADDVTDQQVMNIQYVIGDVLQPIRGGDGDVGMAIIVHCVGKLVLFLWLNKKIDIGLNSAKHLHCAVVENAVQLSVGLILPMCQPVQRKPLP